MIIPTVIEKEDDSVRSYDIYSRLLKDRVIFLGEAIYEQTSNNIVAQLLFLEAKSPTEDIHMYINSPGGLVTGGMAIYDTMRYIKPDIRTICIGQACSMGAFLLAGGTKGKRFALPNARIMIHQPSGGTHGQASDIEIHAKEILRMRHDLNQILAGNTNQNISKIEDDTERDNFMSAQEALDYGLIDEIITKLKK